MNSEALRLLDEIEDEVCGWDQWPKDKGDQLRALLSAQEPTAEHWRQAIRDWYGSTRPVGLAWDWMERRARELAKQEAK